MIHLRIKSDSVRDGIYIPKYYDPQIEARLKAVATTHQTYRISDLIDRNYLSVSTGDEIGKAAYGTGDIPFVRTSDIANWEIKAAPKQGVSKDIYDDYAASQDVEVGDILFVRDGTYLIGNNCFITDIDNDILYQSHVLKIRILDHDLMSPEVLFLAINSDLFQKQVRSVQFTADIIDTIGQRYKELTLAVPKDADRLKNLGNETRTALRTRSRGKAFIKHFPKLIETCLRDGNGAALEKFASLDDASITRVLSSETISSELGEFTAFWKKANEIIRSIYLPKYYDVHIDRELSELSKNCDLFTFDQLRRDGEIEYHTGDEIGKMAYGTGDIPFLRTSDFSNWEIYHNPKQGVSEEIYDEYAAKQDVRANDILLVRDGTYLVGSSCFITSEDEKSLFCGGLYKIRALPGGNLDAYLLLALINAYIVKRQFRARQFTRDVIDTMGNRLDEVTLPIPKDRKLRAQISDSVRNVINERIAARAKLSSLAREIENAV